MWETLTFADSDVDSPTSVVDERQHNARKRDLCASHGRPGCSHSAEHLPVADQALRGGWPAIERQLDPGGSAREQHPSRVRLYSAQPARWL